jgi:hypothetical protein
MDFAWRLRSGVERGDTLHRAHLAPAARASRKRYDSTGVGVIEIDSIRPIQWSDITPELARE